MLDLPGVVVTRLCATRPADWWETGSDGNRLALMLCGVCPAIDRCAAEAGREAGVIRAGVAYGDNGRPLPMCANGCGYPNRHTRGGRGRWNPLCHRCSVPVLRRWSTRKRYWAAYYQRRKAVQV